MLFRVDVDCVVYGLPYDRTYIVLCRILHSSVCDCILFLLMRAIVFIAYLKERLRARRN